MTTLSQQKNKDMEKFDEKFPVIDWRGYPARNTIKSHISQIYINIAKNEIERLVGQFEYEDIKEVWCPKQNVYLYDYFSHHDESKHCENCGSKVEIRVKKELKTNYETYQAIQNQINYWEKELKELSK